MAVSMNAGGYMRSDFFISDAAIPIRMEELDAEGTVKFAELISGLDSAANAPAIPKAQAAEQAQETEARLPEDVRQLAEKIAEGELEPESLPKELVTNELLKAVAALKKQTPAKEEQKSGAEITPEVAEQAAQLAAFVPTDIPDDKTAELSEIAAVVAVEGAGEISKAEKELTPEVSGAAGKFAAEEDIPADISRKNAAENAVSESAEQPVRFTETRQAKAANVPDVRQETAQLSENVAAKPESAVPEQRVQETAAQTEAPNVPEKLTAEQVEVLNRAAENGEISAPEARTVKSAKTERREASAVAENSKPEDSEKPEPSARPANAAADRVKSAAEELEMLRSAKANLKQNPPAENPDVTAKPKAATAKSESVPEVGAKVGGNEQAKEELVSEVGAKVGGSEQAKEEPVSEVGAKIGGSEQAKEEPVSEVGAKIGGSEQAKEEPVPDVGAKIGGSEQAKEEPVSEVGAKVGGGAQAKEELSAKPQTEKQPDAQSAAQQFTADIPVIITRKNGEEVEVKPSEIVAQATAKLVDAAKEMTEDKTEYSMELNPEELGRITVRLAKAEDGTVSVTIAAENARTQRILEQHSDVMQSDLRSSGLRLESWQVVNDAQQDNRAQDYDGSGKNPYHREETPNRGDDADDTSFADIMAAM